MDGLNPAYPFIGETELPVHCHYALLYQRQNPALKPLYLFWTADIDEYTHKSKPSNPE
jgi:hypothetical protein